MCFRVVLRSGLASEDHKLSGDKKRNGGSWAENFCNTQGCSTAPPIGRSRTHRGNPLRQLPDRADLAFSAERGRRIILARSPPLGGARYCFQFLYYVPIVGRGRTMMSNKGVLRAALATFFLIAVMEVTLVLFGILITP